MSLRAIPAAAGDGVIRYAYQCRISLRRESMDALVATLPPEGRAAWQKP